MSDEICPHCGSPVPPRARACKECGSDAETGWLPYEDIAYASVELPGEGCHPGAQGRHAVAPEDEGVWTEDGWQPSPGPAEPTHPAVAVLISVAGVLAIFVGLIAVLALAQTAPWALGLAALAASLFWLARQRG
jgi:hypothetical protein